MGGQSQPDLIQIKSIRLGNSISVTESENSTVRRRKCRNLCWCDALGAHSRAREIWCIFDAESLTACAACFEGRLMREECASMAQKLREEETRNFQLETELSRLKVHVM